MSSSPSTTVMTGTTTQIMIDIADMAQNMPNEKRRVARARLARMTASVLAFASGCATAALFYARAGIYCFLIPPLLGVGTMMLRIAPLELEARYCVHVGSPSKWDFARSATA